MSSFAEQGTPIMHEGQAIAVLLPGSGKVHDYCRRCGGSGHFSFNRLDGTMCYGCNRTGLGPETTEADAIRRAVARKKAAEKRDAKETARLAAQEEARAAWADEHILLAANLADLVRSDDVQDPLLSLAQQAEWRPLSEKQTEFAERLVTEYHRRKVEKAERVELAKNAGHLGEVGGKVEVGVTVVFTKYYEPEMYGRSGSYLLIMKTPEGHTLKGYSSGAFGREAEKGATYRIKATVKSHEGQASTDGPVTVITRIKAA